jgi:hypothetical protein
MNDFVFVALGTGVGAGLYLDGRIHRGARSAAGELGDLVLRPGTPKRALAVSDVAGKSGITERARRATGGEMRAGDVVRHAGGRGRLARIANDVVDARTKRVSQRAVAPRSRQHRGDARGSVAVSYLRKRYRCLPQIAVSESRSTCPRRWNEGVW